MDPTSSTAHPLPRAHRLGQVAVGYGDGIRAAMFMAAWSVLCVVVLNCDLLPSRWRDAVFPAWAVVMLACWCVSIRAAVRIGRALGGDAAERRAFVFGSLLPLTSPFFAGVLLLEARDTFRVAGVTVPLWGVSRRHAAGLMPCRRCPACWYDLTGLGSNTCPECGVTISRHPTPTAADPTRPTHYPPCAPASVTPAAG